MDDQKLMEAVKELLRAAGFTGLTVRSVPGSITLSAERGQGGAALHLVAQIPKKAPAGRTASGGPSAQSIAADVGVVPSLPGLREQIMADPTLATKWFDVSPELVRHLTGG